MSGFFTDGIESSLFTSEEYIVSIVWMSDKKSKAIRITDRQCPLGCEMPTIPYFLEKLAHKLRSGYIILYSWH
jgi:hypothetical protein